MSDYLTLISQLNYLHGKPSCSGLLKQHAIDFKVDEVLPFEFSGDGEHMLVKIEKTGENTSWVAKMLAEACQVNPNVISYAGLKDRHAVTTQWFSIQIPGKDNVALPEELGEGVRVLATARHNRKLKRGSLSGNNFVIRLRDVSDIEQALERASKVAESGVPNYFGSQRFGRGASNIDNALSMFAGKRIRSREKRSMYLSAARSLVFNHAISQRIEQQLFTQVLNGDVMKFATSNAHFVAEQADQDIVERYQQGEIELSAPMVGKGELASQDKALEFESSVLATYPEIVSGLADAGLKMERRALALRPKDFSFKAEGNDLVLSFFLSAGNYATSILREIVNCEGEGNDHISE
ncbi:tRNA pseudouridine(13) synthase TruD [Agarivorans sp. 1_MG-2023]|uniref:tRNA pseudouridine(13) synthase TruD n=1 Tax=Agarivorans sp. 1_MG-2023 TaxID=3062634 RepID=UPI0026E3580C|nr:tRNA pseudouridine(13) synthase TruD [Agarivorans sp. 1_MG-2023]MDO6763157.1 tRNA pseudouridine(13) synthase TruD [Agarivorans sp. 1_MG-2023]